MNTTFEDYIRKDFIEGLIYFSEGKISEQEALSISEKRLRLTDFSDDSPLSHKGPRLFADCIFEMLYQEYSYESNNLKKI